MLVYGNHSCNPYIDTVVTNKPATPSAPMSCHCFGHGRQFGLARQLQHTETPMCLLPMIPACP